MNIDIFNQDLKPIINKIDELNPETVAIVELSNEFHELITTDRTYKPIFNNSNGTKTCNIYTKEEPISSKYNDSLTYPVCIAKFKDYTLIVVHPYPPLSPEMHQLQIDNFNEIEDILEGSVNNNGKFVLIGDFNSTYYSAVFRDVFGEYFHQNTYSWNVNSINSLPIDHALSNFDIEIDKTEKLSSDHTGLLISFD